MNSKTKHLITSSVIAVVIFFILMLFIGLIGSLAVALLTGAATYGFFSGNKAKDPSSEADETEPSATDNANQALLMANLHLRKQIVSAELRGSYESLIDQLIELLPLVNQTDLENELSWVINRMATEYLPNKSIAPYLKLSEAERLNANVISGVLDNINAMKKELDEVKEMVTRKNTNEFSQKAKFLSQRFTEK